MRRLLILATIAIGCFVGMVAMSSNASAFSSCTSNASIGGSARDNQAYGISLCSTGNVHIWGHLCEQMLMPGGWVAAGPPDGGSWGNCVTTTVTNGYWEAFTGPMLSACGRYYRSTYTYNIAYSGNVNVTTAGKKFC